MKEELFYIYQTPENRRLIDFSLCGITHPDKNYVITRPASSCSCIEFCETGSGIITSNRKKYTVGEGDSYFLHEGENQHYYSDDKNPWKKYFVNISGPLLSQMVKGFGLSGEIYYSGLDIKDELCTVISLSKDRTRDSTEEYLNILSSLLYRMYHHINDIRSEYGACEKMRRYIEMRATEAFSLRELCEHVSLSESQAIKIFKKEFSKTPYAYFCDIKFELAKSMLEHTALSVKQIAHELVFSDEYYFSNFFKKKQGLSPREYRAYIAKGGR